MVKAGIAYSVWRQVTEELGFDSWQRQGIFLFFAASIFGTQLASYPMGGLFPGNNPGGGGEVYLPPPSCSEVNSDGAIPPIPQHAFIVLCLIN